jgi:predicted amidohydrolase
LALALFITVSVLTSPFASAAITPQTNFGIAGLQLALGHEDNLARIEAEIRSLARRMPWVRMVMLGELATFGNKLSAAQPMPGAAENFYCALARELRLWLVPGSLYESCDGAVYNTTPVIDPQGRVVGRYRKIYPFLPYERGVASGGDFLVFDVPDAGRFGVSICYDMWFPETTRSLASLGAEIILHPTMTNTIDRDVELSLVRANAVVGQCYVVDINVAGDQGFGQSLICGPGGEVIHRAGSGREVIAFEADFSYVRRCRERGWHGLGQTLKSFRDNRVVFPAYAASAAPSPALSALGPLALPLSP